MLFSRAEYFSSDISVRSSSPSDMRLEQVTLRKTDAVKELLEFYMGKNTMERQNFIIDNLVIEEDLAS